MSQYKIEAGTGQHIGDRDEQQDRTALLTAPKAPGYLLAVVADGMGGRSGGTLAAEQVIHTARQAFERFSPLTDTPETILHAIANEADTVIRLSALSSEKQPHSTVVLLIVTPQGQAIWGHAGDSRLYHFSGPNCTTRTRDHTYQAHLAAQHPDGKVPAVAPEQAHMLVNFLGGKPIAPGLTIDRRDVLQAGDAFLLCTDGLWQYFKEAELGAAIAAHSPRKACEMLIDKARMRANGSRADNCTLAIIKFTPPDPTVREYTAKTMRRAV
ncbi:protein phosphatase [Oxalicibacterium flavum]|uniref:Protein phosphatase n=1 Tax=Oxalicibacterium flavum TaxID=179467 RepID=A0A8J2UK13_9BURK|nr:PP2C family serine/threonine-protein phosphatase [Oxalicibacterium flavum]GGC04394.1 protein phosphatase [Oxalicibacterium flavum]